MGSMRVDCGPVRIDTRAELDGYMDGSAGTVGRIMAPLLGVPERHHADFGRLGLAFQLTNFMRDVRDDSELGAGLPAGGGPRRYGVAEGDLAAGARRRAARAARHEVRRARALFASAGRRRRGARLGAARRALALGVYAACSTASRRTTSTCSAARAGVRAVAAAGAALGSAAPVTAARPCAARSGRR